MNIKKLITGLALSMLLSSGAANADWGDVYYCQMTNFNEITIEGEMENYKLGKLQFKLDQTKNAMIFGSTGVFKNEVYKLTIGFNWPNIETWYASDKYSTTYFEKGKLLYANNGSQGLRVISADCDKF